jgi:hypothetical protein
MNNVLSSESSESSESYNTNLNKEVEGLNINYTLAQDLIYS